MTGEAIRVDHVTKHFKIYKERNNSLKSTLMRGRSRFERFTALDDVSFDVPHNTTFGLIGENGSGKSTLLKCMANILRPNAGHITLNGRMSALLELGAGFHPELSGRENVYLNASIMGLPTRVVDARFDDIVGFAGLEKFIDNPVKNYSSGMYVRLGFSVAIHSDPEVFLVDEVLAVGDEDFQRRCSEKFADLKRGGCTIVLVSHGLDAVKRMCDRAAWLHHGELMATGPADDVVRTYLAHVTKERAVRTREQSVRLAVDGQTVRAAIEFCDLLDADGTPSQSVPTRTAATVRFAYRARDLGTMIRPVLTFFRADGTWVANVQTGSPIPFLHDELVHVDYDIPSLPLQPGHYEVGVALKDPYLIETYVDVPRCLQFEVTAGDDPHMGGLVNLGGSWESGVLETMPDPG